MKYVNVVESGVLFFRQCTLLLDLGQNALQSNQLVTKLDLYEIEKKQHAYLKKIRVKYPYAQGKQTRNQEIFGQKLADYAVDCLWILVIVMQ